MCSKSGISRLRGRTERCIRYFLVPTNNPCLMSLGGNAIDLGTSPDLVASFCKAVIHKIPESHRAGGNVAHTKLFFLLGTPSFSFLQVWMTKAFEFSFPIFGIMQNVSKFPATTRWPCVELYQRFHINLLSDAGYGSLKEATSGTDPWPSTSTHCCQKKTVRLKNLTARF